MFNSKLSSGPPVFVLAATNKRDDLDPALRRPGRLDREVELGVPTATERADVRQFWGQIVIWIVACINNGTMKSALSLLVFV